MKRHLHKYEDGLFVGDPDHWDCRVTEKCLVCDKTRDRSATFEEREEERIKRTCPDCGFLKKDHGGDGMRSCIVMLGNEVADLKLRIKQIEDWRHN